MTKNEIFKFINENPVFFLATCQGNEPRVRTMQVYQADSRGIIFNTCKTKSLHKQLMANPSVELCFYNELDNIQVRIRGKVQLVRDPKFKAEAVRKNPAAESIILDDSPNGLAVYRLVQGKVRLWKVGDEYLPRIMGSYKLDSLWMAMHTGS
ncbi:MAG TPA: pyridoxamine 5'-phosphate oxidase family protein [Planctomycetes bacterium]|nr:pyridoxamine 5'-phosphate oxidase family protein [Planctomycetota bacterium]